MNPWALGILAGLATVAVLWLLLSRAERRSRQFGRVVVRDAFRWN